MSQGIALAALASLAAFFLPLAPAVSVMTGAAFLGLILLATFWLRLSACAASPKTARPPSRALSDEELPLYSIVIALYCEARVLPQLLGALDALAYPRAKLDVKLVLEQDDRETLEALQSLGVPPFCELTSRRRERRGQSHARPMSRCRCSEANWLRSMMPRIFPIRSSLASRLRVSPRRQRDLPAFRRNSP